MVNILQKIATDLIEEKQNKIISELVIESKYNKALLARIAKTLELDKEV